MCKQNECRKTDKRDHDRKIYRLGFTLALIALTALTILAWIKS